MAKSIDVDGIRAAVNRNLNTPDTTAKELAAEAGISPGTLSGFRKGVYKGRNDLVAEKVAHIIAGRQAYAEITAGKRDLWFMVRTNGRVRATKNLKTLVAWMDRDPNAIGYISWWSKDPAQMPYYEPWTRETSNETN